MAKVIHSKVSAQLAVTLELSEAEVRALDGIFGYDVEIFLKVFKERMGRAYVEKHEDGVRSLHATIRGQLAKPIAEIGLARQRMWEAAARTTA
ncbi:MAG TPA: hypothetical protein VEC57_00170 [Candidatus Limnocylindrales bacterium]|nr:hypothetical protein [Candidatus Limnocylindrales bacterium]